MFRLGLDIDGCINNLGILLHEYASAFSKKHGINIKSDMSDYLIERHFGWPEHITKEFWISHYKQALNAATPLPGAPQTISLLRRNGLEIYLITARKEKYSEITNHWLTKYGIKFDKLIMTNEKAAACVENSIDLMVEDEPANCESIAQHIPVLCMSYKYNESLAGINNITRISNWAEIYNEVMHFKKQREAV
jgi:uncharacterized HAD superfamily protein